MNRDHWEGRVDAFMAESSRDREGLHKEIASHNTAVLARLDALEYKFDLRLDKIEAELSMYKTAIKLARFTFYAVLFILAFKFGDIKSLWQEIFK